MVSAVKLAAMVFAVVLMAVILAVLVAVVIEMMVVTSIVTLVVVVVAWGITRVFVVHSSASMRGSTHHTRLCYRVF